MHSFYSGPLFLKGLGVKESKKEVAKVVSLVKMAEKVSSVSSVLKLHVHTSPSVIVSSNSSVLPSINFRVSCSRIPTLE